MDKSKRPTKAAIEAALSAYYGEVDESADKTRILPEQERIFAQIVAGSDDLQGALIAIVSALVLTGPEEASSADVAKSPEKFRELARAGRLSEDTLRKLHNVMSMFFWVGWHARGAMDAQDDLQTMME